MRSSSETIFEGLATYVVTTWPVTWGRDDGRRRWGWEARIKGWPGAGRGVIGCGTANDRKDAALAAAKACIDVQEARLERRRAAAGRLSPPPITRLHSEFDHPQPAPRSAFYKGDGAQDRVFTASTPEKVGRLP